MSAERFSALGLAAVALGVAAILLGSGCGGASSDDAIRIGVFGDCEGSLFGSEYEQVIAGAELPLLTRGADLLGLAPSKGIENASVAGRDVELVTRCMREFSRSSTLAALRLLVEKDKVDAVVGPADGPADGLVVRDYALRHPGVTFVYSGFDSSSTLVRPAPNVFRYRVSMAQWGAGLGAYAYHVLGWRNAVTIGNIEPGPAGFIAEFCSLGGNIVDRMWTDHLATAARKIPSKGVDGVFLPTSLNYVSEDFVAVWARRHPDLGQWLVAGDGVLSAGATDKRLVGVVASNPTPWAPHVRSWETYGRELRRSFPGFKADPIEALNTYDSVEPVVEALEQVHGDTSHAERRLMSALAHLDFQSPEGPRPLDAKHQAIGVSYLGKMAQDAHGKLYVRPIHTVRGVDQSFSGYFNAKRVPSQTLACVHGNPPRWARPAEWSR